MTDNYGMLHGIAQLRGRARKELNIVGFGMFHGNGKNAHLAGGVKMKFNARILHGEQAYARTEGRVMTGSPCSGPTLAEVEKTMARMNLGGCPTHSKRAKNQTNVTWKRKACAV